MIEVKVTLFPHGDRSNPKEIASMYIVNDGSGTDTKGSYVSSVYLKRKAVWKTAEVKNFPRKRRNIWYLIRQVLNEVLYHDK